MVLRAILLFTLTALIASSAYGCRCVLRNLAEIFEDENVATIALVRRAEPSRPFPDVINQGQPITWKLKLRSVYKGDCSLKGKVIKGTSGANGALCGANPVGGSYLIGFDSGNRFNTCLLVRSFANLSTEDRRVIRKNNQCMRRRPYLYGHPARV